MHSDVLRADLHLHTKYSRDSLLSLGTIIKVCRSRGINCIGVTDHNTIEGALKMEKSFRVIVGEEIMTSCGEIIGLFLNERIPKNLTPEETIDKIKEQDGIVYLPHPFDRLRNSRLKIKDNNLLKSIDIVETFNSRCIFSKDNKKSLKLARSINAICGCGSDAHTGLEIGNAFVKMEDFSSKKEFLKNLRKARMFTKKSPIWVHAFSTITKRVKR
jgi:predicted metal-dependent phosphoesterase TrpH